MAQEWCVISHNPCLDVLIVPQVFDVLPGLKPQDSRLPHGKRAQFSSPAHT